MRKTRFMSLWTLIAFFLLIFSHCKKDEKYEPSKRKVTGKVIIHVGLNIHEEDIQGRLKSDATASFKVEIKDLSGNDILIFETVQDMPDEVILEEGEYYVVAHSNNYTPASFDNPYYYGQSENFIIGSEENQNVNVLCELANCAVSVVYSDEITTSFSDYSAEVFTSLGSLTYGKDENRIGYFDPSPITIDAIFSYTLSDGTNKTKTLTGSITDVSAKKHYQVHLDATIANQKSSFEISLNDTLITEVIEISEEIEPIETGEVAYGDILITEIMYDPSAMSDTEGEWFEIYNNSQKQVNLHQLVIKRADDQSHVIDTDKQLHPGEYYVLSRTASATGLDEYIYGTDITLTNTSGELIIATYGTDGTDGEEISSVVYDESNGFPNASGASINLDPSLFDVELARNASSWCQSTNTFSTGDNGSPGTENNSCN